MAEQVERVGVRFARLDGHLLEINPALGKLLHYVSALAGVGPAGAQLLWPGAKCPHSLGSVVGEFDNAELFAVGVQFVDEFGGDFDLAAVEVVFATPLPGPLLGRGGEGVIGRWR